MKIKKVKKVKKVNKDPVIKLKQEIEADIKACKKNILYHKKLDQFASCYEMQIILSEKIKFLWSLRFLEWPNTKQVTKK